MQRVLPFPGREAAGRELATALAAQRVGPDWLVLALPRGGVPVAFEVAAALGAELDLLLVRKLGMPGDPELALGAIAAGSLRFVDANLLALSGLDAVALARLEAQERAELERRAARYRGQGAPPVLRGRKLVLVDDGIATGATMRVAVAAARAAAPARLWVAVPVASRDACATLAPAVDRLVCLASPAPFGAVAQCYAEFPQVSDETVLALLARARQARAGQPPAGDGASFVHPARGPADPAGA